MRRTIVLLCGSLASARPSRRVAFNGGFADEYDLVEQMRGFLDVIVDLMLTATGRESTTGGDVELHLTESLAAIYVGSGPSSERQWVEVTRYPKGRLVLRSCFFDRTGDQDVIEPKDLRQPDAARHFAFAA